MIKRLFHKVWSACCQAWPFWLILIAVLVFFYPVFLQGKIPLPADFIVGTYYPWLDYKWAGYNAGVPVKNPITTDVVSFTYPIQTLSIDLIKQGILPLWNNLILSGTPLLANFQSAPFSPTNIFYFILPEIFAWSLQIMTQPFLAAIFLYLLLRNFRISKLSSVAGGLFYGFTGFSTIWMQWNGHSLVAAFFPLVILLVKKWLENPKFLWGFLLSSSLVLQIFSGYPQIILYEFLALFLLILIFDKDIFKNPKKLIKLLGFLALGIGLAGVQILPGFELLAESQRKVETVLNEWAFLPPQLLITFLAPDFFGNHATGNYWGPADYTLTTGFSGVVVFILAAVGLLSDRRAKKVIFGFSLILVSLIIALPNPISLAFKESGFLGLQAASAHRALILSNLGFAILAAFGLDMLIFQKAKWQETIRAFYLPAILLFSFTAATLLTRNWLGGVHSANLTVGLKNLVLPITILFLTAILLTLNFQFKKFHRIFLIALVLTGLFELFRFGWKFTPFSPVDFVYPQTPVLEFLQDTQKPFRVAAEDVIPINMMTPYQLETVEGYDAVYPLRYAKYLAVLNSGESSANPMGRYGSVSNPNSRLFDLVNGKYILVLKRNRQGSPDQAGEIPQKFSNAKFKKVFEDKTVVVLENAYSLPRAFFVSDWEVERNDQKILNALLSEDFPMDKKIILEKEFVDFPQSIGDGAFVNITQSDASENFFEIQTKNPGFLFVSSNFYPGWKAKVDEVEVPILRADYTFQAIPIYKPGVHQVRMYYDPESFRMGVLVSLISAFILGMMVIGSKYVKRFN